MSNDNDENPDKLTDAEMDAVLGDLTDADLRDRSQALHEAQERWEKLAYVAVAKIPCPECGGAGSVGGGSFGDICVGCMGARVVTAPDAEDFEMPDFGGMRRAISAYGDALADRALPEGTVVGGPRHGQTIRRGLALPPASTVPTVEAIRAIEEQAKAQLKQLKGTPGVVPPAQLAAAKKAKGLTGEGGLDEYEDNELDEMIADAEVVDGDR